MIPIYEAILDAQYDKNEQEEARLQVILADRFESVVDRYKKGELTPVELLHLLLAAAGTPEGYNAE